jgi:hypothetical protein
MLATGAPPANVRTGSQARRPVGGVPGRDPVAVFGGRCISAKRGCPYSSHALSRVSAIARPGLATERKRLPKPRRRRPAVGRLAGGPAPLALLRCMERSSGAGALAQSLVAPCARHRRIGNPGHRSTSRWLMTAFDLRNLISVSSSWPRRTGSSTRTYAAFSTIGLLYQNLST